MLIGSDPRVNKSIFLAMANTKSVTTKIEIKEKLSWFDED